MFSLFKKSKDRVLIVGLGNPGKQYERSRHNVGFIMIDRFASSLSCDIRRNRFSAHCGEATVEGRSCILMKPQTFMNNSGEAVLAAARYYDIGPENIIILCDDISLDPGIIRIRPSGSAGGHNGLKSIIAMLDSDQFARIKIGVGARPNPDYPLPDWVLGAPSRDDQQLIDSRSDDVGDAIRLLVKGDLNEAQNRYNHKK